MESPIMIIAARRKAILAAVHAAPVSMLSIVELADRTGLHTCEVAGSCAQMALEGKLRYSHGSGLVAVANGR